MPSNLGWEFKKCTNIPLGTSDKPTLIKNTDQK